MFVDMKQIIMIIEIQMNNSRFPPNSQKKITAIDDWCN